MVGGGGTLSAPSGLGRNLESRVVRRTTESTGTLGLQVSSRQGDAERVERVQPLETQAVKLQPPPGRRPVDGSREFRSKVEAVYERMQIALPEEKRQATIDLSVLCEELFLAGLSSSRITPNGGKDDRHEG